MIYIAGYHVDRYYGYALEIREENIKLPVCPKCNRSYGERWAYTTDEDLIITAVMSNSRMADFSRYGTSYFVSDRAKEIMEKEKVTGYHLGPINIVGINELTKEEIQELKYDYDIKKIPTDPIRYHRLFADGRIKLHEIQICPG